MNLLDEVTVRLGRVTCCNCGIVFAFDENRIKTLKRTHKEFYCPNGHSQYWPGESDIERERRLKNHYKDMMETAQQQRDSARNKARAEKAAKTRLKNRVKRGVCPCCNRTFQNLARHIETKHPEFKK